MGTAPTLLPSPPSPLHYSADKRAVIQYCRRGAAGLVGLMEIGLACKNAARIGPGLGESNVQPHQTSDLDCGEGYGHAL